LRDYMEEKHPRLIGLIDYPRYRLLGRCMVCGRLVVLHSPWALYVCERVPLPIEITEAGYALLAEEMADLPDTDWQIQDAPVSQANIA
jgi:hypothetical protein